MRSDGRDESRSTWKPHRKAYSRREAKEGARAGIYRRPGPVDGGISPISSIHLQLARISSFVPETFTRRLKIGSTFMCEISNCVFGSQRIATIQSFGSTLNSLPSIRTSICPLSLTSFKCFCSIDVIYRLPGPVEGGIRPRHEALSVATGWSLSGQPTVSSPLV